MNHTNHSTLRLPSYRSSYLHRFHPYPRVRSRRFEVDDDEPTAFSNSETLIDLSPTHIASQPTACGMCEDDVTRGLHRALVPQFQLPQSWMKIRFSSLVIQLALVVVRKLQANRDADLLVKDLKTHVSD